MDAVAPGSFGSTTLLISLVKSDWKLQQKKLKSPAPLPGSSGSALLPVARALLEIDFRVG